MEKRFEVGLFAPNVRQVSPDSGDRGGKYVNTASPIRKQSPEERRRYMREYMRAYRRNHPGLSTPYVRKYRAKQRD